MAWQPPQADRDYAVKTTLTNYVNQMRQAPIDRPVQSPQGSSMTQGQNGESGLLSGPMIPGSTSASTPVGQADQIHMRVQPHMIHGKIQHSLSQALLK